MVNGEGQISVWWQGRPLCWVTADGGIQHIPGKVKGDIGNESLCQVADISKIVLEYMVLEVGIRIDSMRRKQLTEKCLTMSDHEEQGQRQNENALFLTGAMVYYIKRGDFHE